MQEIHVFTVCIVWSSCPMYLLPFIIYQIWSQCEAEKKKFVWTHIGCFRCFRNEFACFVAAKANGFQAIVGDCSPMTAYVAGSVIDATNPLQLHLVWNSLTTPYTGLQITVLNISIYQLFRFLMAVGGHVIMYPKKTLIYIYIYIYIYINRTYISGIHYCPPMADTP